MRSPEPAWWKHLRRPLSPEVLAGGVPLSWKAGKWHWRTHDKREIAFDNAVLAVRKVHPKGRPPECLCEACAEWEALRDARLRAMLSGASPDA